MLRNALNLILIFALLNVSVQLSTIHDYVRQGNYWGILVAVSYSSTRIDQEEWESMKTALHIACEYGITPISEYLIEMGANKTSRDMFLETPLHAATANGHVNITQLLLAHHVPVNLADFRQRTPLHLSSGWDNVEVTAVLLTTLTNSFPKRNTVIEGTVFTAAEVIQSFIVHLEALDESQHTPLLVACIHKHTVTAELLLQHGADITAQDKAGWSALHVALLTENTNLLSILLIHLNSDGTLDEVDSKSNDLLVNRPNKYGLTPLHLACQKNNVEAAVMLIIHGADSTILNADGMSALSFLKDPEQVNVVLQAIKRRKYDIVRRHRESERSRDSIAQWSTTGFSRMSEVTIDGDVAPDIETKHILMEEYYASKKDKLADTVEDESTVKSAVNMLNKQYPHTQTNTLTNIIPSLETQAYYDVLTEMEHMRAELNDYKKEMENLVSRILKSQAEEMLVLKEQNRIWEESFFVRLQAVKAADVDSADKPEEQRNSNSPPTGTNSAPTGTNSVFQDSIFTAWLQSLSLSSSGLSYITRLGGFHTLEEFFYINSAQDVYKQFPRLNAADRGKLTLGLTQLHAFKKE